MAAYLRRFLLMVPTLLGVLLINFAVIQFVPGGPVEQLMSQLTSKEASLGSGQAAGRSRQRRYRRSRSCMALTSLRTNASCKCSSSMCGSTWARVFATQGRLGVDQGEAPCIDQPRSLDLLHQLSGGCAAGRGKAVRAGRVLTW